MDLSAAKPVNMRAMISDIRHAISMAQGELNATVSRKEVLEKDVGEAKWREIQKPHVEKFLEELLEAAHVRRIGTFERLLTALVSEVMPGESPIALDLSIKRNQPWLDILSNLGGDEREDIFEDQGGALTNVIVLGLRLIAVAKANARRIVFLDESDCWVEDERVPAFYNVLADAARKIGFQCFAISHHDIAMFESRPGQNHDGINIARLTGHPKEEGGSHINNSNRYRWKDDEVGLRYIKLTNVQGFHNETIFLSPGITAFVGPNNHGKSTIIRIMRAVFFGEGRDGLITKGATECVVEMGFEKGRVLRWSRSPKRKPNVEIWQLVAPDGTSVVENGFVYDTGGSEVPAWVQKVTGIGPIEGHEPQIIKQKSPIFLLDKPGSVRASVLSIGQETSHIQAMIKLQKETSTADRKLIKEGEAEMSGVLQRISRLEQIIGLTQQVDDAEQFSQDIDAHTQGVKDAEALVKGLQSRRENRDKIKRQIEILDRLPQQSEIDAAKAAIKEAEAKSAVVKKLQALREKRDRTGKVISLLDSLPDAMPEISPTQEQAELRKSLASKRSRRAKLRKGIAILERLPSGMPVIRETSNLAQTRDKLISLRKRQDGLAEQMRCNEIALQEVDEKLKDAVESMGNACPLCGGAIHDHHVLTSHSHGDQHA